MMKKMMAFTSLLLIWAMLMTVGFAGAEEVTGSISADEINSILNTQTDASKVTSPFIEVSNSVRDSVVGVNNYQQVTTYNNGWGNFGWNFGYGDNYGYQRETQERLYSTGSGVVITAYGHILTNYHVVENATRVTITTAADEEEHEATVMGYDADLDIAVLLVEDLNVAPVQLGDSDQLQVGEWAIVIGNPLGERFARTLTVGVVSALNRNVTDTTYDRYGRKTSVTNTMIQVDAAINSGNSGGGMFNVLGQLMGVPARKYSTNVFAGADVDNIGMCIPINVAKPLIESVLKDYVPGMTVKEEKTEETPAAANGLTGKPRMGVSVLTLRNTSGSVLPSGAYVAAVEDGTPAAEAGIQAGDIIVAVNGEVVADQSALTKAVGAFGAGDELTITVYRLEGLTGIVDLSTWTADLEAAAKLGDGTYTDLTLTLRVVDKIESSKN